MASLSLSSGLIIVLGDPLTKFCREEWAYYDGIPDRDPDHILPDDVLATVAMNSFVNNASLVREVHRGLARAVDHLLPDIPPDADLRTFDPDLTQAKALFDAACNTKRVLMPVATKVLHRKRRRFIPMLDNVLLFAYLDALGRPALKGISQDGKKAGGVGKFVLDAFRRDLVGQWEPLSQEAARVSEAGWPMSEVRVLEVAFWIATEPRGYYRS